MRSLSARLRRKFESGTMPISLRRAIRERPVSRRIPQVGNYLLSMLLANAFLINQGSNSRATFSSVRSYIPDLHVTKQARAVEFENPQVRVYKSHAKFHPAYVNVVYLARHPVDVMKSHFSFRRSLGHYSGSFERYCFGAIGAVEAWRRHVSSWLVYPHNTNQRFIHLVRYEDLIADAESELDTLAQNFGWHLDADVAAQATAVSARDAMRGQEALYRSRNPAHRMEFVSNGTEQFFDAGTQARIEALCAPELELLGLQQNGQTSRG